MKKKTEKTTDQKMDKKDGYLKPQIISHGKIKAEVWMAPTQG